MFRRFNIKFSVFVATSLIILFSLTNAKAQESADAFESAIEGTTEIGTGAVTLYQKGGQYLALIPQNHFERILFWNVEVSKYPPNAVNVTGNTIATNIVKLERVANSVFVRSLTGDTPKQTGNQGYFGDHSKSRPIDMVVSQSL